MKSQIWTLVRATSAAVALTLATVAQAADVTLPFGEQAKLDALSGVYTSVGVENWYGAYGTRSFSFSNGKWSLDFVFALDPAMQQKVFEFHTEGPYRIFGKSAAVEGAFEAVFTESVKAVTLRSDNAKLVESMGMAGCNLKLGTKVDVSKTGCASWKPVAVCGEDHDLLAVDAAGKVFFGVRPKDNDMCTADKRPKALLPAVIKR
jgi:opacity protein-like surface antigen